MTSNLLQPSLEYFQIHYFSLKIIVVGSLGGAAVWRLPLAQGVILEARDRIPRRAPCMGPASPSACVSASLSLCVSHEKINKNLFLKIKIEQFILFYFVLIEQFN